MEDIKVPQKMIDECNDIINMAAAAAAGAGSGLAQLPTSDSIIIMPIQVTMIISIGEVFNLNITESMAKSIIASFGMSFAGRTISQFALGWIPGAGNVVNAITAAALTKLIGNVALDDFSGKWVVDGQKSSTLDKEDNYNDISAQYDIKFSDLVDEFNNQVEKIKDEINNYKELIKEYEKYIEFLENNKSDKEHIKQVKEGYYMLKRLSGR